MPINSNLQSEWTQLCTSLVRPAGMALDLSSWIALCDGVQASMAPHLSPMWSWQWEWGLNTFHRSRKKHLFFGRYGASPSLSCALVPCKGSCRDRSYFFPYPDWDNVICPLRKEFVLQTGKAGCSKPVSCCSLSLYIIFFFICTFLNANGAETNNPLKCNRVTITWVFPAVGYDLWEWLGLSQPPLALWQLGSWLSQPLGFGVCWWGWNRAQLTRD